MIPASVAISRPGSLGTPLPRVPFLEELHTGYFDFVLRGGQQTMIAGIPGSQKSGLAIAISGALADSGIPALYFSADMDRHTASTRLAATLTGYSTKEISRDLDQGAHDHFADLLDLPFRFSFNSGPTISEIHDEISAWVEMWDDYPGVIVIDNLLDVIPSSGDSETTGYKANLLDFKDLARTTGAHIFTLHHMSEFSGDPTMPPARKFILGKVAQTPENILSVAFDNHRNQLVLSLVKHRNGPSSPGADFVVRLDADPASNTFRQHRVY